MDLGQPLSHLIIGCPACSETNDVSAVPLLLSECRAKLGQTICYDRPSATQG